MKLAVDDLPLPAPEITRPKPVRWLSVWITALLILIAAAVVRVALPEGFTGVGFDEALYRDYVIELDKAGLSNYPVICQLFLQDQRHPEVVTKLPPTRFLYVFSSWLWKRVAYGDDHAAPPCPTADKDFTAKDPALLSLHRVSCLFSLLCVVAAGLAALRMLGPGSMLSVMALMAFSPTQIHMGHHALIDGFFAFWAMLGLWLLWENLHRPNQISWLVAYALTLCALVMTKENSFFVCLAFAGLLAANRWAKFGTITTRLVLATISGPLVGVMLLVVLAGGLPEFVEIYRLLVSKASNLVYAIKTGDGPWYRYLADMLIASPLVLLLAIGGVFTQVTKKPAYLFLLLFVAFTYVCMCNVRYAMNLRYATIWDLPMCALAAAQITSLASFNKRQQILIAALSIAALCAYGLRQYYIFFVDAGLYELVSEGLLRAVKILK